MPLRAGRLDRRVLLQQRVPTTDAEGNVLDNWTDIGMIWIGLEPGANVELTTTGEAEQQRYWTVVCRYRLDGHPAHNDRLVLKRDGFSDRVLDILSVVDATDLGRGERHSMLELQVRERVA
jgi:head-tail adaptor